MKENDLGLDAINSERANRSAASEMIRKFDEVTEDEGFKMVSGLMKQMGSYKLLISLANVYSVLAKITTRDGLEGGKVLHHNEEGRTFDLSPEESVDMARNMAAMLSNGIAELGRNTIEYCPLIIFTDDESQGGN